MTFLVNVAKPHERDNSPLTHPLLDAQLQKIMNFICWILSPLVIISIFFIIGAKISHFKKCLE